MIIVIISVIIDLSDNRVESAIEVNRADRNKYSKHCLLPYLWNECEINTFRFFSPLKVVVKFKI